MRIITIGSLLQSSYSQLVFDTLEDSCKRASGDTSKSWSSLKKSLRISLRRNARPMYRRVPLCFSPWKGKLALSLKVWLMDTTARSSAYSCTCLSPSSRGRNSRPRRLFPLPGDPWMRPNLGSRVLTSSKSTSSARDNNQRDVSLSIEQEKNLDF